MDHFNQFHGCIIGGAIGDALGGEFENQEQNQNTDHIFIWGGSKESKKEWVLTDDTQLTLATAESIIQAGGIKAETIAANILKWFQANKISGIGSATLQSIRGMQNGGHWALVGRKGEMAAGNGAAMRIAPLAFYEPEIDRSIIRDICRITHHNDEAYTGALAVFLAIRGFIETDKIDSSHWLKNLADQLPDTLVRDRLFTYANLPDSTEIGDIAREFGSSGYVVESIPLALFAVFKSIEKGFHSVMNEIIAAGGDTDTNASIFGQIAGTMLGYQALPKTWVKQIEEMQEYSWIKPILENWKAGRF